MKLNWPVTIFGIACVIILTGIAANLKYNAGFGGNHGTEKSGERVSIASIETNAGSSERPTDMTSKRDHIEAITQNTGNAEMTTVLPAASRRIRVPVVFSGGHETNPVDRGRPVVLIAGALGVTPEVYLVGSDPLLEVRDRHGSVSA